MNFSHTLKIILVFAFTSLQMVSTEQDKRTEFILAGIGYYEKGDFENAARVLKPYAGKPVPVAEPFCLDLVRKGYLPQFEPIPSNEEIGVKARANMWYIAARQFQKWKDKKAPALLSYLEKPATDQNGTLLYLIGTLFEMGTSKCKANREIAKQFYLRALEKNDLRAAFKLKDLCSVEEFKKLVKGELSVLAVHGALSLMSRLQQDEGCIFASLSGFFANSPPKTFPYYLYAAALFGHPGAQFEVAKAYCENKSEALYWLMQSAEYSNLDALSSCGHRMETGKGAEINYEKAYGYLKRAAHHPVARGTDFSNFGLMHELGKGTPVNYQAACEWYRKAYEVDPTNEEFIHKYGRVLFHLEEYTTALPLLDKVQNLSDDSTYHYAVTLEKLTPEGGYLTEAIAILSKLASKGHLMAATHLVGLVEEGKGPNDDETLSIYKGYLENVIQRAILEEKTQYRDVGLSNAYNCLRNLYFRVEWLFSQDGVRRIDLSREAFQFNPLSQIMKFQYAQDLKDNGQCQEALKHFLSFQGAELPVMLNRGSCYDHLSEEVESRSQKESRKFSQKAFECYLNQMKENNSKHTVSAAFNIYSLCFRNRIDPLSDEEMLYYLNIAAEGGDGEALNHLGVAYMLGSYSLKPDLPEAEQLFRKSIDQDNNKEAKMNLMHLQYTNALPETIAEAAQLYHELWTEHPDEFKSHLENLILSVQNVLDSSEQEGFGEDGNSFQETKEEDKSEQQNLQDNQAMSDSLKSSSSSEEYSEPEEEWKKYEGKEKKKASISSLQPQEDPEQYPAVLSKRERQQQEEKNRLNKKYERMIKRVEALPKKQAKYRKIKTLMGQYIHAFGGAVKNASGGSGQRVKVGDVHSGFHRPHGANGSELKGGALNSLTSMMQEQNSDTM